MKSKVARIVLLFAIMFANVAADQVSKVIARANLQPGVRVSVVGDVFIMQLADNPGAFLGLGGNMSDELRFVFLKLLPLIVMTGILAALIVLFGVRKNLGTGLAISLSCVMGGGFSNLIDRFFLDSKNMDFMNFGIGNLRTGILNVADLSITFGAIVAIIFFARMNPEQKTTPPETK